jgi:hypothetical protein
MAKEHEGAEKEGGGGTKFEKKDGKRMGKKGAGRHSSRK